MAKYGEHEARPDDGQNEFSDIIKSRSEWDACFQSGRPRDACLQQPALQGSFRWPGRLDAGFSKAVASLGSHVVLASSNTAGCQLLGLTSVDCRPWPFSLEVALLVMSGRAATPFRWKKCRLDLPGRGARQACKHLPDEHNDVQKKTFTKWINARFSKNFLFEKVAKVKKINIGISLRQQIANQSPDDLLCPWTQFVYLHDVFRKLQISGDYTDKFRFPGSFAKPVVLPTMTCDSYMASGKPPINDMFTDLKDGRKLLDLLEGLTGTSLPKERGSTRVHALNNVNRVLQVLHQDNVDLVNIGGTDIVDGNHKLTLGLLWSIILHWQVKDVMKDVMSDLQQTNSEKILLSWVRQSTRPYSQVNVLNFTTSWTDGLAFNAVLHQHRPDLFSWDRVVKMSPIERLEHAFGKAQTYLGIEKLLDPEDVAVQLPDKKSIIMYLTSLFEVLPQQVTLDAIREVETLPRKYKKECEEGEISLQSSVLEEEHESPGAETPSTVAEVDMDLDSYQIALEEVLTWLLSAEDTFQEQEDIADDVEEVKDQFATHEAFMMELTAHQSSVGSVLQAGNQLITQGTLSDEEEFEIQEQMTLLNARWEALRVDSMDRQSRLHDVLMELQKRQLQQLSTWLTLTEERIQKMETCPLDDDLKSLQKLLEDHKCLQNDLEAEQVKVNSLTHMVVIVDENSGESTAALLEDQLQILKEDMEMKRQALDQLSEIGQDVGQLLDNPKASKKINSDSEELTQRWDSLVQRLEDSSNQVDLKVIEKWMDGVKDFLMKAQVVQGDAEGLQSQLDQCSAFVNEIETVESSLKDMEEIEANLRSCPAAGIKTWMQTKLVDYQTQLEKLSKEIAIQKNRLSESQEKAVNLKKDLSEMQEWMTQAEEEYLERDFEYKSPEELESAVEEMKRAKEDVLQKEVRVKILKDNIMLLAAKAPSGGQELTSELNVVLENYQLLCNRIRGKCHTLEEVWSCWIELLHYLDLETCWLSTLEERMKSTEALPEKADAINEALESLESVLRHPADNRTQIRELGQTLIDGGILDDIISEKLEAFNSRYEDLSHLAESKQIALEKQLQVLRETDHMLQVLQESLGELDKQLTTYLTDRIDAFQVPQEAQKIQAEISAHELTLEELRRNTRSQPPTSPEGRNARGGSQMDLLQRKLREVSTKFQLFQKPANFEQRMLDCKRVLDCVKAELHFLDVKDVDPDVIQSHLDKCMKLYKTLSEVKLEVETVIKTGRHIVQKQQTDNPRGMDEQLTSLKILYNDLGAQVTEGKQDLERASQLARKMKKETASLSEWLSVTEAELVQKSTSEGLLGDLDIEISWAKRLISELDDANLQVENVRDQAIVLMNARGGSSRELVEPKLAELNRNFEKVSQHIKSAKLLIGQEPLAYQCLVTTEAFEADVLFSDLEKLESDIENMLKVVEKHLEFSDEDEKNIKDQLDKLGEQIAVIHEKQPDVILEASGPEAIQIRDTLTQLNAKWDRINRMYNDRKGHFDRAMEEWRQFHCDLNDLTQWITEAEELLAETLAPDGGLDLEKAGMHQQELEEGISSHQPSFAALNRTGDGIVQKLSPMDGSFLRDKLAGLNQRWSAIFAEVKDRRPRVGYGPPTQRPLKARGTQVPADLDKTITELADWLVLIDQMLKSNIVTVGDIEEINKTVSRMKLRVENEKRTEVEKVKNQWDSTQHGVELRQQQLEDMIIDSLQWDDHREETEELMRKYEARLYILQQARRDPLIKQISDNQILLQELGPGDGIVMAFDNVLQKLLEDYGSDDTRNVKETTEYLKTSWINLKQSIADRQSALEAELRTVQASHRDLENFLKWIQEAETTVNVLADASQRENALQDTVLARELTRQLQA
ncbi:hypothetical protein GH733_000794, partial [Mirounga leonina]